MIISIVHIVVTILLIAVILLQMQGTGLGSSIGGGSGEFFRSKRSVEKLLVRATIVLTILFGLLSVLLLFPHV